MAVPQHPRTEADQWVDRLEMLPILLSRSYKGIPMKVERLPIESCGMPYYCTAAPKGNILPTWQSPTSKKSGPVKL